MPTTCIAPRRTRRRGPGGVSSPRCSPPVPSPRAVGPTTRRRRRQARDDARPTSDRPCRDRRCRHRCRRDRSRRRLHDRAALPAGRAGARCAATAHEPVGQRRGTAAGGPVDARGAGVDDRGHRDRRSHRGGTRATRFRVPTTTSAPPSRPPGFYRLQVEGGTTRRSQLRRRRSERRRRSRSRASRCRRSTRRPIADAGRCRSDLHPRTRGLPVPRHHAHRGTGLRQAGGVLRRHAGVLQHGRVRTRARIAHRGAGRLRRAPTCSCTPRCTPTTRRPR